MHRPEPSVPFPKHRSDSCSIRSPQSSTSPRCIGAGHLVAVPRTSIAFTLFRQRAGTRVLSSAET